MRSKRRARKYKRRHKEMVMTDSSSYKNVIIRRFYSFLRTFKIIK